MTPTEDTMAFLDKRISLGLIVGLLAQAGAIIWWASGVENRMNMLEINGAGRQSRIASSEQQIANLTVGAATIAQQLLNLDQGQNEIKTSIKEVNGLLREVGRKLP